VKVDIVVVIRRARRFSCGRPNERPRRQERRMQARDRQV
jgi:hypothetical protein